MTIHSKDFRVRPGSTVTLRTWPTRISSHHAPWYVVPADDKDNARLIVSQIMLDAFDALHMAYPKMIDRTGDR